MITFPLNRTALAALDLIECDHCSGSGRLVAAEGRDERYCDWCSGLGAQLDCDDSTSGLLLVLSSNRTFLNHWNMDTSALMGDVDGTAELLGRPARP